MIINQGMKQQPMAVYRIREILSDSGQDRDSPLSVHNKDQHQYEGLETSLASKSSSDCQLLSQSESGARGYEDGLPVGDFLTKELCHTNIKEGEHYRSVL